MLYSNVLLNVRFSGWNHLFVSGKFRESRT